MNEADIKKKVNDIKEALDIACIFNVRVVYAGKPEWLLLKTASRGKTFGCIRANKLSFASLYLDLKESYDLLEKTKDNPKFSDLPNIAKRKSKINFAQYVIRLNTEKDFMTAISLIEKVINDNAVKIENKLWGSK